MLIKTWKICVGINRNTLFLNQYLDYLEFELIKKQCAVSPPFTIFEKNPKFSVNPACLFQNHTDIFFIDEFLYKNYALNLLGNDFEYPKSTQAVLIDIQVLNMFL